MTTVEIRDPRLHELVAAAPEFERLGTGYAFTEGPVWSARDGSVVFSDMPGDHMRVWREGAGVRTYRQPSNMANGNAYDAAGRLVTCEHATSRLVRQEADGGLVVLASHWEGKELNSPNDVVVKRDGAIYFSDPTYGRAEYYGRKRDVQLGFRGVYRVDPDGSLALLADDFGQPNGLCFSDDEKRLFVNDTDRQHIRAFDLAPDGRLSGGTVWAETTGEGAGAPDGMKLDSRGDVWCCGPGGIHVFAPDATCLGVLRTPEYVANFCFGGADMKTLFVTASTSLYRMRLNVAGRTLP
jgi:gluconolactonase